MICHLSRNLWLCVIGKNNSMRKVLGVSVGLAIKNVQMTRGLRSLYPGQFRVFPARLGGPISSIVLSGKMTNEPIIFPETITALLHHLRTALTNVHMPISITLRKSKQTFQSEIQIPKLKTHFFFYKRNIVNLDKYNYKENCFSFGTAKNTLPLQGHGGTSCVISKGHWQHCS